MSGRVSEFGKSSATSSTTSLLPNSKGSPFVFFYVLVSRRRGEARRGEVVDTPIKYADNYDPRYRYGKTISVDFPSSFCFRIKWTAFFFFEPFFFSAFFSSSACCCCLRHLKRRFRISPSVTGEEGKEEKEV